MLPVLKTLTAKARALRLRLRLRRRRHIHDKFVIECAPLHTENATWAGEAPAQVEAALKRGAHAIGLTELAGDKAALIKQLRALATQYDYEWVQGKGDTALLVKNALKVTGGGSLHVDGSDALTWVALDFHGSKVTVFMDHWKTNHPAYLATRAAQTAGLIDAMNAASAGWGLSFFMADSNSIGKMSDPTSHPRAELNAAGYVLTYEELNTWPAHVGVTMLGHAKADTRVKAVSVTANDPLGSDHTPVTATYSIRR